jgi:hypothetical protein
MVLSQILSLRSFVVVGSVTPVAVDAAAPAAVSVPGRSSM